MSNGGTNSLLERAREEIDPHDWDEAQEMLVLPDRETALSADGSALPGGAPGA